MFWRRTSDAELEACLEIDLTQIGHEIVGRTRALNAWRELMRTPSFIGCTVLSEVPIEGQRIVGFGSGVFVSDAFVRAELGRPQPGMNARIIASVAAKKPVILSGNELARANGNDGVNLVFLTAATRTSVLNLRQIGEARTQLWLAFLDSYLGYRLRLMLREPTSGEEIAHMRSQGIYGQTFTFETSRPSGARRWNTDRALMVSTPEDAATRPGSIASILCSFREPVLGLSSVQQRLLQAALHGLTDQQLAGKLSLKLPAVKKRWAAMFEQVARMRPDLLASAGPHDDGTRGPQKRQYLLDYVREHPEELRPWKDSRRLRRLD